MNLTIIKARLSRQSTWSALAIQCGALAAVLPAYTVPLGTAAAIMGVIKLFVPEDSQETRKAVKAALKEHA
jgi:predicted phage tail protein